MSQGESIRKQAEEFRERYFPAESWFREFPVLAKGIVPQPRIQKELRRIRQKMADIEERCGQLSMCLGDLH